MKSNDRRIRLIWILIAIASLGYVARLYWLQILDHELYAQEAEHQYASAAGSVYDRGSIFFSDKDGNLISAASLQSGFLLAIKPAVIEDVGKAYEQLSAIVSLDKNDFLAKAGKKTDVYEELLHRLNSDTASKLRALKMPWIIVSQEKWRFYPGGDLASNALGLVGYQGDIYAGRYGLERYYDDILSRTATNPYTNIFVQIFSGAKDVLDHKTLQGDIVSTIEPSVQAALEGELAAIAEKWKPETIGGVIINPKTGEIYALATVPNFDPNSFSKEKDPRVFSNPIVEDVYEMGSIIKPLTMSIGIDTGVVTADTTYNDKGTIVLDGARVSNFDGRARGVVDMQEVLNQSLNTGAAFVEGKVGNRRFAQYMLKFGLGEETGIDLPNETYGLVSNLKSPRDLEYATASFGQGIALTPIETVRALSILANGGFLVTPHLVNSVRYDMGLSHSVAPEDRVRVLQASTTDEVSRMLVEVYDKALANGTVKIKNYSVAAKTGTAQIANPSGGGYYDDRFLHSFFGYFPAYNARFLVFLYAVHPQGALYASATLTQPFVDLVRFLINYYHVPPDR